MPSKRRKFLSRVRNDLTRQAENNIKRAFMKSLRQYFATASAPEEIDMSAIDEDCHGGGHHISIEGHLLWDLSAVHKRTDESLRRFFAEVGKRLRSAEAVYHSYVCREGENYVVEYKTIMKFLEPDIS